MQRVLFTLHATAYTQSSGEGKVMKLYSQLRVENTWQLEKQVGEDNQKDLEKFERAKK